ncbi:esterase-like activity of phytase family protein [Sulfitobacter sp. HNIBRBA2951]|uniref:esterase-like activity of phytase family protein n=1 Tax=Sulfitobacter aquimarinus TaxID=3158557 RepID=UPI0032DEFECA
MADPKLRKNGVMRWKIDAPWFGGFSGIEITGYGTEMTVISDRGQLVEATLQRKRGKIDSVYVDTSRRLSKSSGGRLRKKASDAEGLAIDAQGRTHISFEHRHRIMATNLDNGRTRGQINLPFKNEVGPNSGVEALAVGPDSTLYALTEKAPANGAPFPLYAYRGGNWTVAARLPQRGPFVPVGADFDSKGRLWVLERATTPLGFRSRVRLFELGGVAPREYTMLKTLPARFDNLEGISVWDDPSGTMHITMISDDNFMRILRTQIVEYRVKE